VSFSVSPNPVPWTNAAVDGCDAGTPNRWIWTQVLVNSGGSSIIFSQRVNYFDGTQASNPLETVTLAPGQRYERTTRFCSGLAGAHTFRTDWITNTGVTMTGATAQLQAQ
jgi:hypothetical protein